MAFFTTLGFALLVGAWASTLLPQNKTPSQAAAGSRHERVQPPLQLSWAPSWLVTVINNAVADTFDRDRHS